MVRLITIAEVTVGMITLERSGRARVTKTQKIDYGYCYHAEYTEGPHRGEECSCEAIPDVTVWIEELHQ